MVLMLQKLQNSNFNSGSQKALTIGLKTVSLGSMSEIEHQLQTENPIGEFDMSEEEISLKTRLRTSAGNANQSYLFPLRTRKDQRFNHFRSLGSERQASVMDRVAGGIHAAHRCYRSSC